MGGNERQHVAEVDQEYSVTAGLGTSVLVQVLKPGFARQ